MNESFIYSVGHGRKPIELFLKELHSFSIAFLCDVRSTPYSRFNPQYNRESLKASLEKAGIAYVYLGDLLGGQPKDGNCYINGNISYTKVAEQDFFKRGIERLLTAQHKGIRIAMMCSETKPEDCHRSRLIGHELLKLGLSLKHITGEEELKRQEELVFKVRKTRN